MKTAELLAVVIFISSKQDQKSVCSVSGTESSPLQQVKSAIQAHVHFTLGQNCPT